VPGVHVGLNLIYLVPGFTGGTEVYARELIPRLAAERPGWRFTAFVNREAAEAGDSWGAGVETVTVPVRARRRPEWVLGEQALLPRLAGRAGVSLVHSLANTGPTYGRFARVVTVFDLHSRLDADAHQGVKNLGMRVLVPLAVRSSHRVLTSSQSSASQLERLLGTPRSKIDVVPLGAGRLPAVEPMREAEVRELVHADGRRIALTVAAKRPTKNLLRLLDALVLIDRDRRPLLVLPGYSTPHERELRERAAALGVEQDVRFLGWIGDAELEGLYRAADLFVFPSLYEGFGLPVLEAMARGVPVACSMRTSLAEVAGTSAALFDAEDPRSIAATMDRVLSDAGERERLAKAGPRQAASFSWDETARGTIASYERTLARSS
jgi:glycosyltransferase involved in cell wall biosynthesis